MHTQIQPATSQKKKIKVMSDKLAYNPSTWETETGNSQFKASPEYVVRTFFTTSRKEIFFKNVSIREHVQTFCFAIVV
jgi:hypothetical protein